MILIYPTYRFTKPWIWSALVGIFVGFMSYDLGPQGDKLLYVAFGFKSGILIGILYFIGGTRVITGSIRQVGWAYTDYTGSEPPLEPERFARSPAPLVGMLGGLFIWLLTVFFFAKYIPPGFLGPFRFVGMFILALILETLVLQAIVARIILMRVWRTS